MPLGGAFASGASEGANVLWELVENASVSSQAEQTQTINTPTAIWARILRPEVSDMTPDAARFFLKLSFEKKDLDRMQELAVKNQDGGLTAEELEELKNYRQIGLELDMLRAKARRAIDAPSNA
jgi:hypothetical protein